MKFFFTSMNGKNRRSFKRIRPAKIATKAPLFNKNAPLNLSNSDGPDGEDEYGAMPHLSHDSDSDSDSDEEQEQEDIQLPSDEDFNVISPESVDVQEMSIAADNKISLFQQLDSVQFSNYFVDCRVVKMPALEFGTFKYRIFHFLMWLKIRLDVPATENIIVTVYNFLKADSTSIFLYCDSLIKDESKSSCTVKNYCEHLSKFFDWFANSRLRCRTEYRIRSGKCTNVPS